MGCTAHQMHQKLHAMGEATTTVIADALGVQPQAAYARLRTLEGRGLVEVTISQRVATWRSTERPQASAPGLSAEMRDILDGGRCGLSRQICDLACLSTKDLDSVLDQAGLDGPDGRRQLATREAFEVASLRMAAILEERAARLRSWADRCRRARCGESV